MDINKVPKVKARYGFRDRIVVDVCLYCGKAHYHNPGGPDDDLQRLADCFKGEYILDFSGEQPEADPAAT